MYEQPVSLTPDRAHVRLFAPIAYRVPRQANIVPITHEEALGLAAWFPVVWHRRARGYELVAVRSMRADGTGHPPGSPRNMASLPLLLRAYPFCLDLENTDTAATMPRVMFDDVPADEPTDVGAPVMTPDGQLSRGASVRLQALAAFARGVDETRAFTEALANDNLLETWNFQCKSKSGEVIELPDLFVLRTDPGAQARLRDLTMRFGALAITLLGTHRLSLFQASPLMAAALRADASAAPRASGSRVRDRVR